MNENILIVEDEEALRMTLQDRLRSEGYVVDFAVDGEQGTEKATQLPFDLIILDIMLPRRSGLDVCMDIRRAGLATPILLLTARGQTSEKVVGFKLGADDYVTKPFGMDELLARMRAAARRAAPAEEMPQVRLGGLVVDLAAKRVIRPDGPDIRLTPTEWHLLEVLLRNPGRLLSRNQLLTEVWGPGYADATGNLRLYMAQLRRKLEPDPARPRWLITEPGMGYRYQPSPDEDPVSP